MRWVWTPTLYWYDSLFQMERIVELHWLCFKTSWVDRREDMCDNRYHWKTRLAARFFKVKDVCRVCRGAKMVPMDTWLGMKDCPECKGTGYSH